MTAGTVLAGNPFAGGRPARAGTWIAGLVIAVAMALAACVSPWMCVALLMAIGYVLATVRCPELNVVLYYIAGKVGYEDRLDLGWGLSANQVLQVLFGVCLLLSLANRGDLRHFPRATAKFLLAFTVMMAVGMLYTANPEYGGSKVMAYVLLVLPGILYLGLRVRDLESLQRVLLLFLAICAAMMLMGLKNIASLQHGERLAVLGGGANVYARILGTGALLLATFALLLYRTNHRRLAVALLVTLVPGFLVAMYFAGSKGPLLGLFGAFLLFVFLNRFLGRVVLVTGGIALLIGLAGARSRTFSDTLELVTASRLFLNPESEVSYGSYGSRMEFYAYSAQQIAGSPLIGVGTGAWGAQRRLFQKRIYPHNMFVEVASEYGLLMVAALGGFLVWVVTRAWRLVNTPMPPPARTLVTGTVSCMVFWLFNVQVSGDIIDNRNLWIFVALVEIAFRALAERPPATAPRPALAALA